MKVLYNAILKYFKNDFARSYKEYKKELDSYISPSDPVNIHSCNEYVNQNIKGLKYDASKVCTITVRFLSHLKEKHNTFDQENGYKYLYYWLSVEALESKLSIENTLDLYKDLNKIFNNENDGHNIFDKYINQMNKYTCNNLKKFIYLYEVFNKFESEQTSKGAQKKCTSDCVDLYTTYVDECKKAYDYDFCNNLKIFREQYNFFIQKAQFCEGDQYLLPPVEIFDTVRMVIVPFVLILITFLISPLLYKFTPVGPWIRHILVKKRNVRDNIIQEQDHILHNYEMNKDDSKKRYYMLSYNSS
ncbi:PIR Superfamily Protein [Plasmodium ovale curtisi]|uniref:PIR Superfamily Protein n=1 Tax=Plasmodium ovale curtisi TaxID=864141 RepID=A0A1A8WMM9_PLAOA|nr:PIR Superfamily Protein [Plasmodium ovale curtisi]